MLPGKGEAAGRAMYCLYVNNVSEVVFVGCYHNKPRIIEQCRETFTFQVVTKSAFKDTFQRRCGEIQKKTPLVLAGRIFRILSNFHIFVVI